VDYADTDTNIIYVMESKRRQKEDLDDILDAALDELDSDDLSIHSAQQSNNNDVGDGSTNVTAVAKGIIQDDSSSNNTNPIGAPYSLEYLANKNRQTEHGDGAPTSSTKKDNTNTKPQFGPEPPPPNSFGLPPDPTIPPFDLSSIMGGDESDLASSLEGMMNQFNKEFGASMNGDSNNDNTEKALDDMFQKMMMGAMPNSNSSGNGIPSNSNQSQHTQNHTPKAKSSETPRKVNRNNNNGTAKKEDEPNVDESINRLLDGINQAASPSNNPMQMPDNIDPSQFEKLSEEMMSNMMNEFEKMGNKNDSNDVVDGVMKQLLAKDLMYEPMKEVCTRFPKYLAENKATLSNEEYNKYGKQYQYFQRIVKVYETEPTNFDRLMELMQEIQEYGQPPVEIIKDLAPELEFDDEGMPIMDPMSGGGGGLPPMMMPGMMSGAGNEQCCIS